MNKRISMLIFLVFSISALNAQDTIRGFIYGVDGLVKWQHEFSTNDSIDKLYNYMIENRKVTECNVINERLSGVLPQLPANYKLAGYNKVTTPNYLEAYDLSANVLVQFKSGKYRVTLSCIRLINNGTNYSFTNPFDALEEHATNRRGFTSAFRKASSTILDTTFIHYFSSIPLVSEEW
jgi:hypothetical protein